MNELALFAGAGGGILGGKLLGWRTVCAVERDAYASQILAQRQNDRILKPFPIWSDITTFDGKPWAGIVDVVSGGFPCQDISAAGKGAGIEGARSGMWKEMARIIGEVRPRYAFVENSPMLTTRGLGTVLADLAAMGFNAEWGVLSAADVGANHKRERIWILATNTSCKRRNNWSNYRKKRQVLSNEIRNATQNKSKREKWQRWTCSFGANVANTRCEHGSERNATRVDSNTQEWAASTIHNQPSSQGYRTSEWWETEPNVGRVANGMAFGVDRLKAIGNGQVPLCAATAFELLRKRLNEN
jgi:DNA (cytosine-5)-methyltransferase 1